MVQLIVNDGFLNSLPATAEKAVVSQQTSLVAQIQERQGVIATLPNDAFKFTGARALISLELNAVLLSIEKHDYRAALLVLHALGKLPRLWSTTPAPGRIFKPRPGVHTIYERARRRQQDLYDLLIPSFGERTSTAAVESSSRKKDLRSPAAKH